MAGAVGFGSISYYLGQIEESPSEDGGADSHELVNWSNTHQCKPKVFHEPETPEEVEAIVSKAQAAGKAPQRVLGRVQARQALTLQHHDPTQLMPGL